MSKTLTAPIRARPDIFSGHPFGTNNFSLDILSRVIYGARASLLMALAAVLIGLIVGGLIGMVSGYLGGKVDWVIGILNNTLLAFPPLVLLLALATVMEPRRAQHCADARHPRHPGERPPRPGQHAGGRRAGVRDRRPGDGRVAPAGAVQELLPNVAPPLVSYGLVLMALLIVAEASLSFLGLGVQPPNPSWGNMISEGNGGQFEQYPHVVIVPGVVVFLTVFAFNLVGRAAPAASGTGWVPGNDRGPTPDSRRALDPAARSMTCGRFATARGTVPAVDGVSLTSITGEMVGRRRRVGVGQVRAGPLGRWASYAHDAAVGDDHRIVRFDGRDLLGMRPAELRALWGTRTSAWSFQQTR